MRRVLLLCLFLPALASAEPGVCTPVRDAAGNMVCDLAPVVSCGTMDMKALGRKLRDTHALGLFTKLRLKSQADDLIERGRAAADRTTLRSDYDALISSVVRELRRGGDAALAGEVECARGSVWTALLNAD